MCSGGEAGLVNTGAVPAGPLIARCIGIAHLLLTRFYKDTGRLKVWQQVLFTLTIQLIHQCI